MSKKKIALIIIALLFIDQAVKIWIKTNMTLGESITVFPNWFFIHFVENPGAAFGMQIGGDYGKLILSVLRIVLIAGLFWYIGKLIKKEAPTGVLVGFGLILAGALGNIIDSAFYGMIFSESTYDTVATLFPVGGGYACFLHGKVVDMLYFPLFSGTFPTWFPWSGGQQFTFFSPVFNLADSYVSVGFVYLLIFQRKYFSK